MNNQLNFPALDKKILFAVYDNVAKVIQNVFVCFSADEAMRLFKDMSLSENSYIRSHAVDFDLKQIAIIDVTKAEIVANSSVHICNAEEFLVKKEVSEHEKI